MNRKWIGCMLLLFVIPAVIVTEAQSQTFDGITIIDFGKDAAGGKAIVGRRGAAPRYLVVFVSAQGTYAALGDGNGERRECVAWAQAGSYTGDSIAFGLPPSEQSMRLVSPRICMPFTLRYEGSEFVRIEAANKFEPLHKNARIVRFSRKSKIIARIPLIAFDWGRSLFSRYNIKGIKLGPLPALRAGLSGNANVSLGQPGPIRFGKIKSFRVTMKNPSDRTNPTTVNGRVVAAEATGWPWDVLYLASYRKRLPQRSFTEVFDKTVDERYGKPSLKKPPFKSSSGVDSFWFFDLEGRQLKFGSTAPGNCLATWEHWKTGATLPGIDADLGPWGCALTMKLTHNGGRGTVSEYSVETTSGYALALNHLFARLEEMRTMKKKIQEVQSYEPEL